MKCPNCKTDFKPTPSQLAGEFGSRKSKAKAAAARANGKKGGRPKKETPLPKVKRWGEGIGDTSKIKLAPLTRAQVWELIEKTGLPEKEQRAMYAEWRKAQLPKVKPKKGNK